MNQLDSNLYTSIQYHYGLTVQLLSKTDYGTTRIDTSDLNWNTLLEDHDMTLSQYDLLEGRLPIETNELVVIVDQKNQINQAVLSAFGFDLTDSIDFKDIIQKELVVGYNDDVFMISDEKYIINTSLTDAYMNGEKLTVVGVLRGKADGLQSNSRGVYYQPDLITNLLQTSLTSQICVAQTNSDYNVQTLQPFSSSAITKDMVLQELGCVTTPNSVDIYPVSSEAKDKIKDYLNSYNVNKLESEHILYDDLSESIASMLGKLVSMISSVLVAFAGISLVVSSIMIGIITYVSVLERTKEIGILRSLGARKKDISRVFNAETVIIGLTAGLMGILITYVLSFPLNIVLSNMDEQLNNVVDMTLTDSLFLIGVSIVLTFIAGLIPSRIASKKNPVEALRYNE